ncbi:hypothetical protein KIW84_025311 [Lathyrus oleraceus]|uniref:Uncharacterized protein n=1 Tax=Pisum sativum TaxID=3888 RepID=A0A9D5BDH4_PEA|nr:hypothetical protein KIW84_025311 [Pisum sativum]
MKDSSVKESYTQWVKERVQLIRAPFEIDPTYLQDELVLNLVSIEEVNRLKADVAKLEGDKESLEYSLYDMTYKKNLIRKLEGEIQYLRDLADVAQVIVQEQGDRAKAWRMEHSDVAELDNNMVQDIPRMFIRDENMANFHNTPQEVLEFVRLCDVLLKKFRAHLKVVMEAPL